MTAEEFRQSIKDEIADATLEAPIDAWWTFYTSDDRTDHVVYLWTRWKALSLLRSKATRMVDTTTGGDSVKSSQFFANLKDLIADAWSDVELADTTVPRRGVGRFKSDQAYNEQYEDSGELSGESSAYYPPGWDFASVGGTFA